MFWGRTGTMEQREAEKISPEEKCLKVKRGCKLEGKCVTVEDLA